MAAQENHVDVVSYLLANGANQDITTEVCIRGIRVRCGFIITSVNKAGSCDRSVCHSVCHSVNRITDERGNGRRPDLARMGKG